MSELVPLTPGIAAMSDAAIAQVRALESLARTMPQVTLETGHVLHGGLYARTLRVPAGVMITGALVKVATLLVIEGDVVVRLDGESVRLGGYSVLPASAGRKQAFVAVSDTHITMIFPTGARTVAAAEAEFTDEVDKLASRCDGARNTVIITGE
jgi:hypothetical protein